MTLALKRLLLQSSNTTFHEPLELNTPSTTSPVSYTGSYNSLLCRRRIWDTHGTTDDSRPKKTLSSTDGRQSKLSTQHTSASARSSLLRCSAPASAAPLCNSFDISAAETIESSARARLTSGFWSCSPFALRPGFFRKGSSAPL